MDGECSRHDQLETILQDLNSEPQDLSLAYLKKITNEFADELLLGKGGFGKVYKGVLQNGRLVAVKKLYQLKPELQAKQFENEVYHLMRLKHLNIVRFLGYCYEARNKCVEFNGQFLFAEKQQRLLCLEYLSNGSLDGHLSDESCGLDWGTRYKIIKGICYGIHYLHEGCKYQINGSIIHLDLKPANILLDDNMVPKVADFGLSRLFHGTKTQTCTTNLVGTFAYMAPEYIYKHVITTKADIYSLGVLIIEIITGDRPDPFSFNSTSREDFIEAVLQKWRNRSKDAPLETDCNQIKLCLEIGLKCFKVDRNERPTAKEIIDSLDGWERRNSVDKHKLENTNSMDKNGDALRVPDPATDKVLSLSRGREGNSARPVIPDGFHCPISRVLMKDPVTVATGQTYERGYIEMWLEGGHDTCPKTQQKLANKSLTPNYALRSLITRWCEANGIEPPKRPANLRDAPLSCSAAEHSNVFELLQKLSSQSLEDQRGAAGMLLLLAKRSTENRACIGDAGAIPILVSMLSTTDVSTQEHVVTALLNLSIYEENKARIISSGAVPGIVHVLKRGSMEARDNSAATLSSLSIVDENKVIIGASGAIPALVQLLSNGSQWGKMDAATALFNLCIYQGNKGKAVRAGLVPILLELLMETESGMVDLALATLAILSSHPEGTQAIGAASAIPVLVRVIRNGSPRNKENAAAVIVDLCICNGEGEQQQQHLAEAQEQGIVSWLEELAESGTDRGKSKAVQLLLRMSQFLKQQSQAQA